MIQSPGTARVQAGSAITIPMSSDRGAVTWAKTSGPAWLSFPDTAIGECSGTAVAGQDGLLVVTATDADGNVDTAGVVVTVLPAGLQIVYDPVTAPPGETVRALPEVWGANGPVRWTMALGPPGWTVDPQTGEASGPMPAVSAGVVAWGRDLYGIRAQAALTLTPRAAPAFDAFVEDAEDGLALVAGEDVDRRIRAPGATPPLTVGLEAAPEWARVVQGTATEDPRLQGKAPASANGLVAVRVTDADGGQGVARAWARVTDALPLRLVLPESITDSVGDPLPPNLFARVLGGTPPYTLAVELPIAGITFDTTTHQLRGVFPSTAGTEQLRLSVTDSGGNRAYATMNVVSVGSFLVTYAPVNVQASASVAADPVVQGTTETVTYAKLDGPSWLNVDSSTGRVTGTASSTAGVFLMRVVATAGGAVSHTATVRVTVTAGTLACSIPDIVAQRGTRGSVTVQVTNAGTGFSVEKARGPSWLNVFSFGLITWNLTPGSTDRDTTDTDFLAIRVRRTGGGVATCLASPTITAATPPPAGSCTISGPATLATGTSAVYTVVASATASSYSLTEAGAGATVEGLGGGRYRVTATATSGATLTLRGTAVVNGVSATCSRTVTVTAQAVPLACTVRTLRFVTGGAVTGVVAARGGTESYTYAATGLPAGVTLNAAGTFGGTAPSAGSYRFSVTVTDSGGTTATCSGVLVSTSEASVCAASPSFSGRTGATFSGTITAPTGAGGAVTYTKLTGPDWLTVNLNGQVSGTFPTTAGSTTWSYQATTLNGTCTGTAGTLTYAAGPLACSAASATGFVDEPVSAEVVASGGTPPYTLEVTSGAGVTVSGSVVTLAGSQTAKTVPYTVRVTDSASATATCSGTLTVGAARLALPISWGDDQLPARATPYGATFTDTLRATGGSGGYRYTGVSLLTDSRGRAVADPNFSINETTGVWSYVPPATNPTPGGWSGRVFQFTVTDSSGARVVQGQPRSSSPTGFDRGPRLAIGPSFTVDLEAYRDGTSEVPLSPIPTEYVLRGTITGGTGPFTVAQPTYRAGTLTGTEPVVPFLDRLTVTGRAFGARVRFPTQAFNGFADAFFVITDTGTNKIVTFRVSVSAGSTTSTTVDMGMGSTAPVTPWYT